MLRGTSAGSHLVWRCPDHQRAPLSRMLGAARWSSLQQLPTLALAACAMASSSAAAATASAAVPPELSVLSLNLLSPGYFRKADRSDKKKRVEASHHAVWRSRLAQEFVLLRDLGNDVAMLQELWYKPDAQALMTEVLGDGYALVAAQRTGKKEDGVALLVRTAAWRLGAQRVVQFNDAGDRCLALALITPAGWGGGSSGGGGGAEPSPAPPAVIVATTHLTYPTDVAYDRPIRQRQADEVVRHIGHFAAEHGVAAVAPVVLGGDMNGPATDPAVRAFTDAGFVSAFSAVHGREAAITHLDHAGHAAGVDFIFWRPAGWAAGGGGGAAPAELLPSSTSTWTSSGGDSAVSSSSVAASSAAASDDGRPARLRPALRLTPAAATLLPAGVPDTAGMCRPIVQHASDLAAAAAAAAHAGLASPTAPGLSEFVGDHRERSPIVVGAALPGAGSGDGSNSSSTPSFAADDRPTPSPPPVSAGGAFTQLRPAAALSWHDYCQLTDHRAVAVRFGVGVEG